MEAGTEEIQEVEIIAELPSNGIAEEAVLIEDDDLQIFEVIPRNVANNGTEEEAKRPRLEECSDVDDEGQRCTICFELWSNCGRHQLCSLKCGHLFGLSCIQRWLGGGNKRCPQCNARAKKSHIRPLYASSLVAVDSSERDRVLEELQVERRARQMAEEKQAKAVFDCQMARVEVERLKRSLGDLERLSQQNVFPSQLSGNGMQTPSYHLQTSCIVSEDGGVRLLDFSSEQLILAASKQRLTPLSGCGILKISLLDTNHREYVAIHTKPLKDLHFNPCGDGLLLSCSLDKTVKLTNLHSNIVVQSYMTPSPVWSCSWNRNDHNSIFCGLGNGKVLLFDLRRTSGPVTELAAVGKPCPVISITSLRGCGILVATLGDMGICNEQRSTWQQQHLLKSGAPISSMNVNPDSLHTMLSVRLSTEVGRPRCQHQIGQVQQRHDSAGDASETPSVKYSYIPGVQLEGGMHCTLMTRSRLYSPPEGAGELLAAAADEMTRTVCIWDVHSGIMKQRLPPCSSPVLDLQHLTMNDSHFLATVTDRELNIYNWR